MARTATAVVDVTLVDASSLFEAGAALAEFSADKQRRPAQYDVLRNCLDRFRREAGWPNASTYLALAAVDPANPQQQRFVDAVRHAGFEVDVVPYRDTFPSLPPGVSPSAMSRRDPDNRPTPSFAARIAYIAGLLARHEDASLVAVSHAFELHGPFLDLSQRLRGRRIGFAYFRSLLDYRWQRSEILNADRSGDGPKFFDLDPYSQEIFGVNIDTRTSTTTEARAGFSRF